MSTLLKLIVLVSILAAGYIFYKNKTTVYEELKTVPHVNLNKYIGTWYEIARYPNWFQRKCARNVTAHYETTLGSNIQVENSCVIKSGKIITSVGVAQVVDRITNAKLKVSFFSPLGSFYYIIGLDENYQYALIGEPKRKYLWILSRTKTLDAYKYQKMINIAQKAGYDTSKLVKTVQN